MKCKICKKTNPKRIVDLKITSLFHCNECGVVFASPNYQNRKGDFFDAYRVKEWLKYYQPFRCFSHKQFLLRNKKLLSDRRSVLDIGCAAGWFLDEFKYKYPSIKTIGIEPSLAMKDKINRQHRIYWTPAEKLNQVRGKFDVITFWNVFEHFSNPHFILDLVVKKLNKNGMLVLSVPNQHGLISRISYLANNISKGKIKMPLEELFQTSNDFGHLFHYSKKSLSGLLKQYGFDLVKWEMADIVDIWNVKRRLTIDSYQTNKISRFIVAFGIAVMTLIARMIGQQDEMVIIARKNV